MLANSLECRVGYLPCRDEHMDKEVENVEKLALLMGFEHEDIIMFENLTATESHQALVYGPYRSLI